MSEQDHNLTLNIVGQGEFEMTRDNAFLYTFAGNLATRNHVFLKTDETEEILKGMYIFAHHDSYVPLASFMVEHEYPMKLNWREVADCDERAFQQSLESYEGAFDDELEGGIPDDWIES